MFKFLFTFFIDVTTHVRYNFIYCMCVQHVIHYFLNGLQKKIFFL